MLPTYSPASSPTTKRSRLLSASSPATSGPRMSRHQYSTRSAYAPSGRPGAVAPPRPPGLDGGAQVRQRERPRRRGRRDLHAPLHQRSTVVGTRPQMRRGAVVEDQQPPGGPYHVEADADARWGDERLDA